LTASELALTLLHCDKICVCTQDVHIVAAPVTFAVWALIVLSDNGLNGSSEIDAAGRSGVARLVPARLVPVLGRNYETVARVV
jgi:hypothetical protein